MTAVSGAVTVGVFSISVVLASEGPLEAARVLSGIGQLVDWLSGDGSQRASPRDT